MFSGRSSRDVLKFHLRWADGDAVNFEPKTFDSIAIRLAYTIGLTPNIANHVSRHLKNIFSFQLTNMCNLNLWNPFFVTLKFDFVKGATIQFQEGGLEFFFNK